MVSIVLAALIQDPIGVPRDLVLRHPSEVHLSGVRQLTFAGQNAEAYWNTDGTRIIFQSTQDGFIDEQIFVMNADGREKKMVSSGKGRHTCGYFVPRSNDIVFSATDWHDPGPAPKPDMSQGYVWMVNPFYRVFRATPSTGQRRQLLAFDGYQAETTIAPNGSFMTFTSTKDGDLDIYRSKLDGSNVVRLTDEEGYDGGPFVSWDGKQIVYRRAALADETHAAEYRRLLSQHLVRPGRLEIWIMDADGQNKRQVTKLGAASFAPFVHPDGKRIIFSSNYGDPRGREFDLWMINLDGSGLERITYTPEFDGFPMFTRDGKRLVWASNRNGKESGDTNVFVCDWRN
jgi:Tol biopolymer transport system component